MKNGRVKKEERKRKEKKKEERTKQKTTLGKKKRKMGRKSYRKTANFGREETKFASCDIPIKYEITLENGEVKKCDREKRGDRCVFKGGVIHSREKVEKTNHTRCEIENVKMKPPHTKKKKNVRTKYLVL